MHAPLPARPIARAPHCPSATANRSSRLPHTWRTLSGWPTITRSKPFSTVGSETNVRRNTTYSQKIATHSRHEDMKAFIHYKQKCDLCDEELLNYPFFYDVRTENGMWGWICEPCFHCHHYDLGIGQGQKFCSKTLTKVNE